MPRSLSATFSKSSDQLVTSGSSNALTSLSAGSGGGSSTKRKKSLNAQGMKDQPQHPSSESSRVPVRRHMSYCSSSSYISLSLSLSAGSFRKNIHEHSHSPDADALAEYDH